MSKEVFTGTQLGDTICWFRWWVRQEQKLDSYGNGIAYPREFGTLTHAIEAAYDLGKDYKKGLKAEVRKIKAGPDYSVVFSKGLYRLEQEALKLFEGGAFVDGKDKRTHVEGYIEWSSRELKDSKVVDVEKRMHADVGPCILAPKNDLVIVSRGWTGGVNEDWWVVERKTTTKWDDANWRTRWIMDAQTTIQILACQAPKSHGGYGKEFGVAVEPIQYSRQQRKNVPDPQPIGKAQRLPLKWVRKPEAVLEDFLAWLQDFVLELKNRREHSDWPKSGYAAGACQFCSLKKLCRGELDITMLKPIPKRS